MYIVIENEEIVKGQIRSRKNGVVYFTAEQNALMFTEGSQYPHHFKIRLAFDDVQANRDQVGPIAKGKYTLADSAYSISRFSEISLQVTAKNLKPVSPSASVSIPNRTAA